ncbi:MAG TPA: pyridoxal 5'-phosphate synthase glutaminase subunit PdxT [Methanoregulaceae archaeon]|nr:pyridoxal 5'-phosphate synthase glutaminase subunit PdxT [Methanoregulaceae archaeon]
MDVKIGVLALQGDVSEHVHAFVKTLRELGVEDRAEVIVVRNADQIYSLDALAIPGGESTTISRLIEKNGMSEPITSFGGGIFATCAGMVLMAGNVDDARVRTLDLMDIDVVRNAFGRQKESFEMDLAFKGFKEPFHAIFIRAPVATRIGTGVKVLSRIDAGVVAMEQGRHMALAFHPELGNDFRIHKRFLQNQGIGVD